MKSAETIQAAADMGASRSAADLIAGIEAPTSFYRVRYGYINETHLGDFSNSETTSPVHTFEEAIKAYKALAWLSVREPEKRRFVMIEHSHDGGETWPTKLFHDCQGWRI